MNNARMTMEQTKALHAFALRWGAHFGEVHKTRGQIVSYDDLPGLEVVIVVRVPGDRGTICVPGAVPADERGFAEHSCPCCGRTGHIAYLAPQLERISWERHPGRPGKWVTHESHSTGDSYFECVWCGIGFAQRDLIPTLDDDVARWQSQAVKDGYVVRLEGEPDPPPPKHDKAVKRRVGRRDG